MVMMFKISLDKKVSFVALTRFLSEGTALEKAGGREFQDAVKDLRKAQGPLEVASGMGKPITLTLKHTRVKHW